MPVLEVEEVAKAVRRSGAGDAIYIRKLISFWVVMTGILRSLVSILRCLEELLRHNSIFEAAQGRKA